MEYSVAGKNVIWENSEEFGRTYPIAGEWHNYGGYKNWIGQKNRWQWPPDPVLDYGKANVEVIQSPNEPPVLIVTGAPSLKSGVLFVKEITLTDTGEVLLKQRMQNISSKDVSYSIWDVTQMDAPSLVVLPMNARTGFSDGIIDLEGMPRNPNQVRIKDGLCITKYTTEACKIGADSNGPWMLWIKNDLAYVKLFPPMVKGAEYPDGCSVEVYANDSTHGYMEMELLSPISKLKPGAQSEFIEKWRLVNLSEPVKDEGSVSQIVNDLKDKGLLN